MSRQERIRQAIRTCIAHMATDDPASLESAAAEFADLQPELGRLLKNIASAGTPPVTADLFLTALDSTEQPCLTTEGVMAFVLQNLSPEQRERVEFHLDNCAACCDEVDEQMQVNGILECWNGIAAAVQPRCAPIAIPGYDFIAFLDSGSQGEVWQVRHRRMNQLRAAKIFPVFALSAADHQRLRRETSAMSRLGKHRHRVMLFDLIEVSDYIALIMEYVDGGSLKARYAGCPLPWREALRVVAGVAEGLLEVHRQQMLHRDIKPSNILLDRQSGDAVLCDFGLAVPWEDASEIVGTPGFAAPELLAGPVSTRSDVFSLAATLYYLLVGRPPFDGLNLLASLQQARCGLARPVAALAEFPLALQNVVLEGLAPQPSNRTDLPEFLDALHGVESRVLAATLVSPTNEPTTRLDVSLSRRRAPAGEFEPLAWSWSKMAQDMPFHDWPSDIPFVRVDEGDVVALAVRAGTPGYLTILNLGMGGEITVMYPPSNSLRQRHASTETLRLSFLVSPPRGVDHLAILWHAQPSEKAPEEWRIWLDRQLAARLAVRQLSLLATDTTSALEPTMCSQVVGIVHASSEFSGHAVDDEPGIVRSLRLAPAAAATSWTCSVADDSTRSISPLASGSSHPPLCWQCEFSMPTGIVPGGDVHLWLSLAELETNRRGQPSLRMNRAGLADLSVYCSGELSLQTYSRQPMAGGALRHLLHLRVPPRFSHATAVGFCTFTEGHDRLPVARLRFELPVSQSPAELLGFVPLVLSRPLSPYGSMHLISHPADASLSRDYCQRLRAAGIICDDSWLALSPEQRWQQRVAQCMRQSDAVLIVWSNELLQSALLMEEVRLALRLQAEPGESPLDVLPLRGQSVTLPLALPEWERPWGRDWPPFLQRPSSEVRSI